MVLRIWCHTIYSCKHEIALTLCPLGIFSCFYPLLIFFQNQLFWKIFQEYLLSVKPLELDQAQCSVWPDLGPNCLQRLWANKTSSQWVQVFRKIILWNNFWSLNDIKQLCCAFITCLLIMACRPSDLWRARVIVPWFQNMAHHFPRQWAQWTHPFWLWKYLTLIKLFTLWQVYELHKTESTCRFSIQ